VNRSRERPELYEVLRQMRAERASDASPAEVPARSSRPEREAAPITFGSAPFITLQLSIAAGLAFAAVFVVLIIAAFLLGSQMNKPAAAPPSDVVEPGADDGVDASAPKDDVPPGRVPGEAVPSDRSEAVYAVRVSTVNADQFIAAQRVVSILQSETGEKAWTRQTQKHLIIYLGRFTSRDDPELKKMEKRVRGIHAGRNVLFPDAFIVELKPKQTSSEGE